MSSRIKQTSKTLAAVKEEKEQWKREKSILSHKYRELQSEVDRAKENVARQSQQQRDLQRRLEIMRGSTPTSLFFSSH
jgi:predicted  nucleic acid-binding Zn-ribbon protein